MKRDPDLQRLLEAAAAHRRQSDPEYEVGDLQEILRSCWWLLSRRDRLLVLGRHRRKGMAAYAEAECAAFMVAGDRLADLLSRDARTPPHLWSNLRRELAIEGNARPDNTAEPTL
jgi:hypothetical protein